MRPRVSAAIVVIIAVVSLCGAEYEGSCTCGISSHRRKRVVGGERADINRFPWVAELRTGRTEQYVPCGGALINRCYVLTAAHCFKWQPELNLTVTLGTDRTAFEYAVTRNVVDKIRHPEYDRNHTHHDIMLLRLDRPVEYDSSIQPICLPDSNRDYLGEMVTVLGFGRLAYKGNSSDGLRAVSMPVITNEQCQGIFNSSKVFEENICAGGEEGKDACQGDSGSPLIHTEESKSTIVGIVSWGTECARKGIPGVYTRVSKYVNWIREVTTSPEECCSLKTIDERFIK